MFAVRLSLTLQEAGRKSPVPKPWLDQFFMRNFTGYTAFDDTLVRGDGALEAGLLVDPSEVREKFEAWLRGRKMIEAGATLAVE
ncbi:MAG: hypothetical protein ACK5AZ_13250 [Bryobacteraceae bacterium]